MGKEKTESDKVVNKMFAGDEDSLPSDQALAVDIIHQFNICRDTLETMPAFREHIEPLFCKKERKE